MEVCKEELCESNEIHEDLLKIVDETLPEETELYDLAELFKVFGDSTRIRILFVLFEAEVCVCDLAKALNMTQSDDEHIHFIFKAFPGGSQKALHKRTRHGAQSCLRIRNPDPAEKVKNVAGNQVAVTAFERHVFLIKITAAKN